MTKANNIPRILDTPAKQREWLEVCEQIKQSVAWLNGYKKDLRMLVKKTHKLEKQIKELRDMRKWIEQGKPRKQPHIGYQTFEEEE